MTSSTKELAWRLGLLRKRSSSIKDQGLKRIKRTCQEFAYLIVIDFESTCWENTRSRPQEIIEFPAVLLNTSTGVIESEFHYYVQPQEHPTLSDFCKELTGINQDQVDQGIPLAIVLKKFSAWLNRLSTELGLVYDPSSSEQNKCTFVTWSDWDLAVCLHYETRRKQLRKPTELNNWIDLRATYRKFYQRRPQGLNGALKDLGIEFEGREHSGVCDARNTAKLAWRMMTDGCILQVTKSLGNTKVNTKIPVAPLRNIKKAENASLGTKLSPLPPEVEDRREGETKHCNGCINMKTHIDESAPTKPFKGSFAPTKIPIYLDSRTSPSTPSGPTTSIPSTISNIPKHKIWDNSLGQQASDFTGKGKENITPLSIHSMRKTGKEYSVNSSHMSNIKNEYLSTSNIHQFRTPNEGLTASNRKPFGSLNTMRTPVEGSIRRAQVTSLYKKTPPLCECGRRTHRKIVQKPGPNQGRAFYACPNGRNNNTAKKASSVRNGRQEGCRFFKWEVQGSNSSGTSPAFATSSFHNRSSSINGNSLLVKIGPLVQPNFEITSPWNNGSTVHLNSHAISF